MTNEELIDHLNLLLEEASKVIKAQQIDIETLKENVEKLKRVNEISEKFILYEEFLFQRFIGFLKYLNTVPEWETHKEEIEYILFNYEKNRMKN